ncbi:translocase of inner mitochondrial membrane 23 [Arctopsyche grandis]|uniref:translocase of inner mitochondrial membrane 23 n=1 Tax=Arctopsyche grandis TaxID=121162 RepID=UPI00406D68CF
MASVWNELYGGDRAGERGGDKNLPQLGAALSPYMQFDPNYLGSGRLQPEFIYPDERHKAQTSRRTAVALPQVGASCIAGAGLGGAAGFYNGLRATTLAGQIGKIRRTQVLNYIMKQGSATGCTLGIIASFYSVVGVGVSYARDKEDSFNTFLAAGTTGALYKCTSGLRATAIGAGFGLGLAAVYTLFNSSTDDEQNVWGKFKQMPL